MFCFQIIWSLVYSGKNSSHFKMRFIRKLSLVGTAIERESESCELKRALMLEQQDMKLISHTFLAVIRGIVFY